MKKKKKQMETVNAKIISNKLTRKSVNKKLPVPVLKFFESLRLPMQILII